MKRVTPATLPPLPPLLMELLAMERFTEEASSMSRYSWGMVRGVLAPPVLEPPLLLLLLLEPPPPPRE